MLASPALIAVALLLAIFIINPIREMTWNDDAWAYARMVQHLLATGRYQLDPWAAANMPVQTYLAAALSKALGYSLSLLRCTTLALLATALFSFYALLRELGHTRPRAAIITLALLASPLVLILGFTFMSDVQFLGWFVLSLWLYVRGIRRRSAWSTFFASLAAGCAIGTRQFGMAIVVGIVITWALAPRNKRPPVRLLLLGIMVPLIAAAGQLVVGLRAPNITQIHRLAESREMFAFPATVLLKELFWRFCVIAQYAGMSALPLLPVIFTAPRAFWEQRLARIPLWTWALLSAAVIVAALCLSSSITARPEARHHGLWEPLELYWELPRNLERLRLIMRLLDLAGILGAASLFAIVLSKLRGVRSLRSFAPETIFLSSTALCLLLLHLFYRQLCDTYILPLIPFVLLLVASHLRNLPRGHEREAFLPLSAWISLVAIVGMSLWIRGEYESTTAVWAAIESLTHNGAQKWDIAAESTWLKYHGSFSEWVAAGHPGYDVNHRERYPSPLDDPFFIWERKHFEHPTYCVVLAPTPEPPPGWRLVSAIRYRNQIFSARYALALKRDSSGQ